MYLIGNNFDGQVIDEANYKVYGKQQVINLAVPKSVISTTKKFVIIASMLYELNHNETVVYGNIIRILWSWLFGCRVYLSGILREGLLNDTGQDGKKNCCFSNRYFYYGIDSHIAYCKV